VISVIIINWNAGSQIYRCIESVLQTDSSIDKQIVVVDNGSIDGSDLIVEAIPEVSLIRTGHNMGFAKACNIGASYATGDYLLFLNPDTYLMNGALSTSVGFLKDDINKRFGVCGVQLINEQGHVARSCVHFPTLKSFTAVSIGLNQLFPRLGYHMTGWDHKTTIEVDHVIGAFYLVRRSVFEALAGFDERFFVYLEDLDFSYRARKLGWSIIYLAGVQTFHAGGGTSDQVKDKRLYYALRSRILYAFKHFNIFAALLVLLVTVIIEPVSRTILCCGRMSWKCFKETGSAYLLIFTWLPKWIFNGVTR